MVRTYASEHVSSLKESAMSSSSGQQAILRVRVSTSPSALHWIHAVCPEEESNRSGLLSRFGYRAIIHGGSQRRRMCAGGADERVMRW